MTAAERTMIETFTGHKMVGEQAFTTSSSCKQPGNGYYLVVGKDKNLPNAQRTVNLMTYAIHCKGVSKAAPAVGMRSSVRVDRQGNVVSRAVRPADPDLLRQPAKSLQIVLVKGYTGTWRNPEPRLIRRSEQARIGLTTAIADAFAEFENKQAPRHQVVQPAKLLALASRFAK
jgi:hypothetical protein